jgi:molybdopterin molybdotransferase
MATHKSLLSYTEAAQVLQSYLAARPGGAFTSLDHLQPTSIQELVPLAAATGRVLATGLRADRDQPPFPRSTRDGFACRAAEASTGQFLFLAGQTRAGESSTATLAAGEAWEIMTGAAIPSGADAVFMVEYAEQNSNFVRLIPPRTVRPGENVVAQAAEARMGDLLLPPGVRLGPAQIALAAQCGYNHLSVVRQPRVAILATGDELVQVEDTPGPSQIRNSNSPMLAALVTSAGGIPIVFPTIADTEAALDEALREAAQTELILISGGISAGKFDLVAGALERLGAEFFCRGVAMQPGKPVAFGQIPGLSGLQIPFFALPGNPISSAATFHLFTAPVLAALSEDVSPLPRFGLAQFSGRWQGQPGLTRFLPAYCDFGPAPDFLPTVRQIPWQGSGDLAAFAQSNCFLVVSPDTSELGDDSIVRILLT